MILICIATHVNLDPCSVGGLVGFGGPRFVLSLAPEDAADNMGFIIINITDIEEQDNSIEKLRITLNDRFPGMFFRVNKMFLGSSDSSEINLKWWVLIPMLSMLRHKN